jgi:D-alanine--D-alanine ligase
MFKIAVICGGPTLERGISLNSARSILDHLSSENISILPLYVDYQKNFYQLSPNQLYSNTPADFDFKLADTATLLDKTALIHLLHEVDLVFPAIHGPFGEDGELQKFLEDNHIHFVGSTSQTCQQMFNKHRANEILKQHHYPTVTSILLEKNKPDNAQCITNFFHTHQLSSAIVKPVAGGSSLGVFSVENAEQAYQKMQYIYDNHIGEQVLLEPFLQGKEFTILVFENAANEAVALIPTHIEINYHNGEIFDYRRKYLPTANTFYHTPAPFHDDIIQKIRSQAEEIFKIFKMRDFVRLDGWLIDNERIYFTDFNPISGLEQNSFVFRQSSIIGLSHHDALTYIIKNAATRAGIKIPENTQQEKTVNKKNVFVLFGGKNAERQVSLMSGTNVWLKLLRSPQFESHPYFLDNENNIWKIPYSYALNHTTEEVYENCIQSNIYEQKAAPYIVQIREKLGLTKLSTKDLNHPQKMSLEKFAKQAKKEEAFIFIALHGGEGENGTLQDFLSQHDLPYNGSHAQSSRVCMDKYLTGEIIRKLNHPKLTSLPKRILDLQLYKKFSLQDFSNLWQELCTELASNKLIIKPSHDGCSAGITLLNNANELQQYFEHLYHKKSFIPAQTFINQPNLIELPEKVTTLLVESYIEVDPIRIHQHQLIHDHKSGWIELTVGVLESQGHYHTLNPSITIAEGAVLSLEEKFQGGTGINLTPPPDEILSTEQRKDMKQLIEITAKALGIQNYARIDIFYNRNTNQMIVIEANSLPALTPSTVIYHQALAEEIPLKPTEFLEKIITAATIS